ncbi:phosphomevalonate kinase [Kwoniella dejecticola CBS 10117]|uniref:Phosphomevalonate kinase n=1 Tax=Kwoniella dejecticola CBS 10117 TaxID=1296121 RepID=A0AAJ8MJZ3_9TREE
MAQSSMSSSKHTVVSSPGKVLLAGGYLVLERAFSGLVVATSSRFYSSATHLPSTSAAPASSTEARISVRAGQFPRKQSEWIYKLSITDGAMHLDQMNEAQAGSNKFIYLTLLQTMAVAYEKIVAEEGQGGEEAAKELLDRITQGGKTAGLDIVVLADNDFYSQREQLSALSLPTHINSLSSLEPFTPLPRPIAQTNKTGLGSSAALVTSLVASLLSHLGIVTIPSSHLSDQSTSTSDLGLVHSVAQFIHCLAQGKVGSGFDVSSAVFGTHIYTRFSPSILTPLMHDPADHIPLNAQPTLLPILDPSKWDQRNSSFRLPRGLRLILADVDAGTDTPSFVGKVLKWRKENPEVSDELWRGLDTANMQLERLLSELAGKEGERDYSGTISRMAERGIEGNEANPVANLLHEIRTTLFAIRGFQRKMSELSGVPIEPPEQTRLIDACSELPGVIGGGVPGAGGFDALFLLIIDDPSVIARVDGLWSSWKEMSVCPLLARQSDGGLRVENVGEVAGLRAALTRS